MLFQVAQMQEDSEGDQDAGMPDAEMPNAQAEENDKDLRMQSILGDLVNGCILQSLQVDFLKGSYLGVN